MINGRTRLLPNIKDMVLGTLLYIIIIIVVVIVIIALLKFLFQLFFVIPIGTDYSGDISYAKELLLSIRWTTKFKFPICESGNPTQCLKLVRNQRRGESMVDGGITRFDKLLPIKVWSIVTWNLVAFGQFSIISSWGSDLRVSSSGVCNTFDSYSCPQFLHVTITTIMVCLDR